LKEGLLIYGCYGYTGDLISRHAAEKGLKPTLAGRDKARTAALAKELNLPYVVFDLADANVVKQHLQPFKVVLHCAGPFQYTAKRMIDACLATGTHYLDITGEYQVFEDSFKRNDEALATGIVIMSGVGFDVVPSDCTAKYLSEQLPNANSLELCLYSKGGRLSHGTAITVTENMGESTYVRRNGQLKPVSNGSLVRKVFVDNKDREAVAISWGDISTAYRSTGIPDITVYNALPTKVIKSMRMSNYLGFIFRLRPVKNYLIKKIKERPAGPTAEERQKATSYIWGEVKNAAGEKRTAVLKLPEGYTITYLAAVRIAEILLADTNLRGSLTPAQAFGYDFVLQFEGTELKNL
jgi:short subunit dehydrogenase-like uncharacterized protein